MFKASPNKPNPDAVLKAAQKSIKSQSNGALMRITPMAVFCHKLTKEEIYKAAAIDTLFTHSNETVIL